MDSSGIAEFSAGRTRALVVEDEGLARLELEDHLRRLDCDVIPSAADGTSAIERVRSHDPDILLMDVRLACGTDGIATALEIRKISPCPVIFVTAFADRDTLQRASVLDPAGFLPKPIDERALHSTIGVAIARRKALSERGRLQDELSRRHKAEALADLAGSLARDFNNVLQVTLSAAERIASSLPPEHPAIPDVELLLGAGRQGAALTRYLLLFARCLPATREKVALDCELASLLPLLRSFVGGDVVLSLEGDAEGTVIQVDRTQFEQALLALVANARDAMVGGGRVTIRTSSSPEKATIEVSDSGPGIAPDVLPRIFEPLFSTKPKRAGLGLMAVKRFSDDNHGEVSVESPPEGGARFRLHLPRADK